MLGGLGPSRDVPSIKDPRRGLDRSHGAATSVSKHVIIVIPGRPRCCPASISLAEVGKILKENEPTSNLRHPVGGRLPAMK